MSKVKYSDLPDSAEDREKLKADEAVIELPDVQDIPGQENITVPPLGELADVTISSADEEGEGLWADEVQDDVVLKDKDEEDEEEEEEDEEDDDLDEDDDGLDEEDEDELDEDEDDDDELDEDDEDEELDDDDEEDADEEDKDGNVTGQERDLLQASAEFEPSGDELALRSAELDNTDDDGELLNEVEDFSGSDLDIPADEQDPNADAMGQGDEENSIYSLGGDRHEDNEEVRE